MNADDWSEPFEEPVISTGTDAATAPATTEKLNKVLARAGIASRRACEDLIRQGRVRVNGHPARIEDRVDASTDTIMVDRQTLPKAPRKLYIMLHKPRGYVTTVSDPQGRRTVTDLVQLPQRLYPVGRLDYDSSGLLLLTNDGDLAQRLTHPSFHVPRIYLVSVRGDISPSVVEKLRRGVEIDDGVTAPAQVEVVERALQQTLLRITLFEGRKRQIRRMCKAVSHPVVDLHRIGLGTLRVGDLAVGRWRHLRAKEVLDLQKATRAPKRRG